jgi:hypothetical protein
MGEYAKIDVAVGRLPELAQKLTDLAAEMRQLASGLAAVVADTGRDDSDQMGRLGPAGIGSVVELVHGAVTTDTDNVRVCATDYAESDLRAAGRLRMPRAAL